MIYLEDSPATAAFLELLWAEAQRQAQDDDAKAKARVVARASNKPR